MRRWLWALMLCRRGYVRVEGDAYRCAIVQQLGARFEELGVVLNEEGRRRQWLEMDEVAEVVPD
jgi:hypothetical protein